MTTAVYHVEHRTQYAYASTVAASQHIAYLQPRTLPWQDVRSHDLVIEPAAAGRTRRTDYFGNVAEHFEILRPHTELLVTSASVVEVRDRFDGLDPERSTPWREARAAMARRGGAWTPDDVQFVHPSPYAPAAQAVTDFAHESFPPDETVLGGALHLTHRIYAECAFDPAATSVARPVTEVLAARRGVCQDFAHVQVSALRSLGLAARYVSGYLLTDPPPGQARLIGADASHAWISVFCPHYGWVDLDPTNDVVAGRRHVTLAWGRDYGDVSPLRGVLLGGTEHTLSVGVSVIPLDGS